MGYFCYLTIQAVGNAIGNIAVGFDAGNYFFAVDRIVVKHTKFYCFARAKRIIAQVISKDAKIRLIKTERANLSSCSDQPNLAITAPIITAMIARPD